MCQHKKTYCFEASKGVRARRKPWRNSLYRKSLLRVSFCRGDNCSSQARHPSVSTSTLEQHCCQPTTPSKQKPSADRFASACKRAASSLSALAEEKRTPDQQSAAPRGVWERHPCAAPPHSSLGMPPHTAAPPSRRNGGRGARLGSGHVLTTSSGTTWPSPPGRHPWGSSWLWLQLSGHEQPATAS